MKIALYSHSIPPAVDGVSRRMASLLQQLVKQGHEVRRRSMYECTFGRFFALMSDRHVVPPAAVLQTLFPAFRGCGFWSRDIGQQCPTVTAKELSVDEILFSDSTFADIKRAWGGCSFVPYSRMLDC